MYLKCKVNMLLHTNHGHLAIATVRVFMFIRSTTFLSHLNHSHTISFDFWASNQSYIIVVAAAAEWNRPLFMFILVPKLVTNGFGET